MTIDTTKTYTGICKWYGTDGKVFGFITPDEGTKDVFVHASAVTRSRLRDLNAGDVVEFTIEVNQKSGRPCVAILKLI
jgi:CspA family cold shock protein